MKWGYYPLKKVAPKKILKLQSNPDVNIWHLTLDQIESNTGRILKKKIAPASTAGNSTYIFDNRHVLYSKLRPYLNKVVCPDEIGIATTELVPLFPNPKLLDRKYLTYYLRSKKFLDFAIMFVSGAKMPRVIMEKFWEHKIPIPPLSEQGRIVEILEQGDDLRKLRVQTDEKTEQILPRLFIKMFGDPAANPKKWMIEPLRNLIEIGTRLVDPNLDDFKSLPHIGGENIESNSGRILQYETVNNCNLRSNKFYFSSEHILYSKIRPYLNKVTFPQFEGLCSADIYPLIPKDDKITPKFLVALLRTQAFLDYAKIHSDRLRIPKLNKNQIGAFEAPVPDRNLLVKFERQAIKIAEIEKFQESRKAGLEKLFSVILHRAFTGDLTASWRKAHMKELLQEMEIQSKALAS